MKQQDQIEALRAEVAALRADMERAGKNFIVLLDLIKEVLGEAGRGGARSGWAGLGLARQGSAGQGEGANGTTRD